jgi:hypothetical protein
MSNRGLSSLFGNSSASTPAAGYSAPASTASFPKVAGASIGYGV